MSNTIRVKNKIYKFPRLEYETNNSYFVRKDFFVRVAPKTEKEYKTAVNMSIVYENIVQGNIYPANVILAMDKIY